MLAPLLLQTIGLRKSSENISFLHQKKYTRFEKRQYAHLLEYNENPPAKAVNRKSSGIGHSHAICRNLSFVKTYRELDALFN